MFKVKSVFCIFALILQCTAVDTNLNPAPRPYPTSLEFRLALINKNPTNLLCILNQIEITETHVSCAKKVNVYGLKAVA